MRIIFGSSEFVNAIFIELSALFLCGQLGDVLFVKGVLNSLVRDQVRIKSQHFEFMNGAGLNSPRYFGAAFISTRAAPEPHQERTKEFMNEAAPAPA